MGQLRGISQTALSETCTERIGGFGVNPSLSSLPARESDFTSGATFLTFGAPAVTLANSGRALGMTGFCQWPDN